MPDGNEKIKSALDIALERAQKLGSLSAQERQSLRDKELATAGEALVKRHLAGLLLRDVEMELKRYGEEDRETVTRYMLSALMEAISIEDLTGSEKVLAAVQHLSGDVGIGEALRELFHDYQEVVERAWQENHSRLEAAQGKELALKGISGSAVEVGIENCAEWLEIRHRLDSHYRERLEAIKESRSLGK